MKRQNLKRSCLYACVALLNGCGGAGGLDTLQGGIEGSGHRITASGAVTALGSIFVNNVEYDLAGATITINGSPASESDLAPGQVAIVEGEVGADGRRGSAKRVTVDIAVAGPVSTVDVDFSRITILGQAIAIDSNTNIEGQIAGSQPGGLGVGRDVEVFGFADSSGVLHARRIEWRKANTPMLITGRAAAVDTSAHTFLINGQLVSYATATVTGFESRPLMDVPVRVTVKSVDQGTLVADDVSLRSPSLPGTLGDTASLQGWVTRFASESDFDVDGHVVVWNAGATAGGGSVVRLDAFVAVSGALITNGAVSATDVKAVLPGHLTGDVTIDNTVYGILGPMTSDGAFHLNIEEWSGGPPVSDSGLGQLVGRFTVTGTEALGVGVLIGESCAPPAPQRFCGKNTAVRLELSKTGSMIDEGSSGVIRVASDTGEETWPLHLAYWGGQAGFGFACCGPLQGLYAVHQAEFTLGGTVMMSIDSQNQLFFQSAETGCTGSGSIVPHAGDGDLHDAKVKVAGCNSSFAYLNTDFEGLAMLESLTPWDYDFSVLRMWLSTPAGAVSPAAITLWAEAVQ